ncbi:hypothetical protein AAMO2058_000991000 [Amorphochlora amoebiformis]
MTTGPRYEAFPPEQPSGSSHRHTKKGIVASVLVGVVIFTAMAVYGGRNSDQSLSAPFASTSMQSRSLAAAGRMSRCMPTVVSASKPFSVGTTAQVPVSEPVSADTPEKLRIKLKSFSKDMLREAVDMIQTTTSSTGSTCSGVVMLPTRRRIYCVLRSPHVNKDSREHFEIRTHQRLLDITDLSPETVDALMTLDLPAGVDVNIRV